MPGPVRQSLRIRTYAGIWSESVARNPEQAVSADVKTFRIDCTSIAWRSVAGTE